MLKLYLYFAQNHLANMISINACVIHEVIKEAKKNDSSLARETVIDPSAELLDPDDEFVQRLLSTIHISFGDDSALRNTHFEKDQSTVFSTAIEKYLGEESSDNFLEFSTKSIKAVKSFINKENFATGGYYVFGDYTVDGRRFISVMVVRKNSNAINFKKVGNVIVPTKAENINTEKIAMGFRLNFSLYQNAKSEEITPENERNYIALVAGVQDSNLSGYFKDWVNAAGIISNVKNSSAFVEIINSIDLPLDEKGKVVTREEFKRRVFSYAEQSNKKMVDIKAISEYLYNDGDKIMNFADSNGFVLDPEFKRASQIFRKLVTIRARIPGIELNVDFDKLNPNDVDVQATKIVIKSKSLIEQINTQRNG